MAYILRTALLRQVGGVCRGAGVSTCPKTGMPLEQAGHLSREERRRQIAIIKDAYKAHAHGSITTWLVASAIGLGLVGIFLYRDLVYPTHYKRPEYKEWANSMIQTSQFPWGDGKHTLFHNPQTNPIPGVGYEEDEEEH